MPGHQPKDSPRQLSYWKVLKAVKEKEGVRGLYKGACGDYPLVKALSRSPTRPARVPDVITFTLTMQASLRTCLWELRRGLRFS